MQMMTEEVANAKTIPGEGKPRRILGFGNKDLISTMSDASSLYENFLHGVKASGDNAFLGTRAIINGAPGPFVWQTYNEVYKRVKNLASGLIGLNLAKNASVGLFSVNRAEWLIGEQACFMQALVTVPLYDTLGVEAIEYIVNQTDMTTVLATKDKVNVLLSIGAKLPTLKNVIFMDAIDEEIVKKGKEFNWNMISITDLEAAGAEKPVDPNPPTKEDIATICYTSGTTGLPKGVVLTHLNIVSFAAASMELMNKGKLRKFGGNDLYLSYLPLAHVFERCVITALVYAGAQIGFYQGDTLKLLDDVAELKPTIFASVPRLYNRIYDKVMAGVNSASFIKSWLFNTAFKAKKANLENGVVTHFLWDWLVFGKVREKLGGRVELMMSGAAPISPDVMDFLRICFSATVQEGYGQTETAAGMTLTTADDVTSGHVGVPFPNCEVKLVDLPEMGYTSNDKPFPRGEICCRGNNVFREYYKLPDKTAETIDKDGWCHSGDVGMWDDKGRLKVIDRVKNMFKLAQGEYVAAERIETILCKHELVSQVFVYGDSLQATLVGIVVPDPDVIKHWAVSKGFSGKTVAELVKDDAFRSAVQNALQEHGKANDLKGFECLKSVYLDMTPFSVENGILTPTFKLKRHDAKKHYKAQIDQMYAEQVKA